MSIVKINAITVPRERFDEFAERFASSAGHSGHREHGPVGNQSEIWSFGLLESKATG